MKVDNTKIVELTPEDIKDAIKMYLESKGITAENEEIDFIVKDFGLDDNDRSPYCAEYRLSKAKVTIKKKN